jgi:hypothetical protein
MKKIFTFLISALVISSAFAQYQRMVLFEEFTQASCGPCASQNPAFNELLDENLDKATSIKYQVWWPGYDPMYEHNTTDVDNRVAYYGVTGVPNAIMDGVEVANDCGYYDGAPACVDQTDIDNQYAVESPFFIELSHTVANDYGSVDVEMYIASDDFHEGDYVANIAVVERAILFETAPGSNGETEFFNVMKKMLPTANGTDIADSWGPGDALTIMESWDFANVYDPSEIAVVAFIQDNTTKEIIQAAYSAPYPVFTTDVTATGANATGSSSPFLCDGTASPSVTIKNIGEVDLTSATITYSVNGGADETYEWTGSLAYGESETVTLPEVSFTLEDENTVAVTISNPNGGADGYLDNNEVEALAFGAPEAPTEVIHLKIRTDNYPEETTWEILDGSGIVVASGGPYNGQKNTIVVDEDIAMTAADCYSFVMEDTYGDGICCAYGLGYWEITDADGSMLVEGGEFGSEESKSFKTQEPTVSIDENSALTGLNLYPNPANNTMFLNISTAQDMQVSLIVTDMLGRRVLEPMVVNAAATAQTISIPVAQLAEGFYTLSIIGNGVAENRKFDIVR